MFTGRILEYSSALISSHPDDIIISFEFSEDESVIGSTYQMKH